MPQGWHGWSKRRSIDFGYNDPFVCQWWAGRDDEWYLYREIFHSGRIIEDHAKQIVSLSQGEEYECTVADHDREDRETLHRHGVDTIPAVKDIEHGIDEVKARLQRGTNARPRLFFLKGCTVETDPALIAARRPASTVEEFDAYLWKTRRGVDVPKDEPADADNHGMDAMRYHCRGLSGSSASISIVRPVSLVADVNRGWTQWA
jgi:phage terminase large subunit